MQTAIQHSGVGSGRHCALSWLIAYGGKHWYGVSTDRWDFLVSVGVTEAQVPTVELRVLAASFPTGRRCSTSKVVER
jgi:hypothetical protein